MKCRLKSLSYENIRAIEKLDIKFDAIDGTTNLLIRNGIGKTTTLTLLRACLTGSDLKDVKSFAHFTGADATGDYRVHHDRKGKFTASLVIVNDEDEPEEVDIIMYLDYEENKVDWETIGARGSDKGWEPPSDFKLLFKRNQKLINFYIFDGEACNDLINSSGSALIKDVVLNATGMNPIRNAYIEDLPSVRKAVFSKAPRAGADTTAAIKTLQEARSTADKRLRELSGLWRASQKIISDKRDALEGVNQDIADFQTQKELIADIEKLNERKGVVAHDLTSTFDQFRSHLLAPENISDESWKTVVAFCEKLENNKLPGHAASFFHEICKEDHCICGAKMTDSKRSHITQSAKNYLGSDVIQTINSFKTASLNYSYQDGKEYGKKIASHRRALNKIKNEKTSLTGGLSEKDQRRIKKLEEIKEELQGDLRTQEIESLRYRAQTEEQFRSVSPTYNPYLNIKTGNGKFVKRKKIIKSVENINVLHEAIAFYEKEEAELSGLKAFQDIYDLTVAVARELKRRTTEAFNEALLKTANQKIKKAHAVSSVLIGSLSDSKISFVKPDGTPQNEVNGAMQRVVGYSFIASLSELSSLSMFVYLDSPFQGMGRQVARPIQDVIPVVFPQSILAIHDLERDAMSTSFLSTTDSITVYREDEDPHSGLRKDGLIDQEGIPVEPTGQVLLEKDLGFFENYHSKND